MNSPCAVQDGTQKQKLKVRGFRLRGFYEYTHPLTSGLESQENYRAVLKNLGAEILYGDPLPDPGEGGVRLDNHGKMVWIHVTSVYACVNVDVIEGNPFQLSIKPPQADTWKAALDKDGHVASFINFDFNKATLKPDAQHDLSDVKLADALDDRGSFRRFCGFSRNEANCTAPRA